MRAIQIFLLGVLIACYPLAKAQQSAAVAEDSVIARYDYQPHATLAGVGEITLELRDAITKQPLDYSGKRLAGWLQKQPKALVENDIACSDKVRALASQGIGRRAAVDFNTYSLVTINTDRTVAFINPFLKLNNAKLEGVVMLPGDATAIVQHRAARELWIAMKGADAVAVIDTDTRQLKRTIQFATGSAPQALVVVGKSVWISFAHRNNWLRFDSSASAQPDATVDAPAALQLLASDDAQQVLGLSAASQAVVMSIATRSVRSIALAGAPTAATWSPLSQRWLIATDKAQLVSLDGSHAGASSATDLPLLLAYATQLMTVDNGRYALALMPSQSAVAIVDVATSKLLQTVKIAPDASELSQTGGFAYVYSPVRGQASLLSLPDVRMGNVRPVQVAIGAIDTANRNNDYADVLRSLTANTPDGVGMLIASPSDGQIYQYAEGMMAPIGSFSNYKRSASAMLLLNHGFESLGSGRYRATLRHTQGGPYELVLSGVQPRFASCQKLALPDVHDTKREALAAQPQATLLSVANAPTGAALAVQVKLENKTSGAPVAAVPDLMLLAFDKRSGWQRRVPLVEQSPGLYVGTLPTANVAPHFELLVSSATQDMPAGLIGAYEDNKP